MRILPMADGKVIMSFAMITLLLMSWTLLKWPAWQKKDQKLSDFLPNKQASLFWRAVAFIGQPKLTVVYILLLALILWQNNERLPACWVIATLGSLDLVGIIVKRLVKRKRPRHHLPNDNGYSFPSGHVLGTTTLVLSVTTLWPAWQFKVIGFIWLSLVLLSRLFLRAHYPTDVLSTVIMSWGWVALTRELYAPVATWLISWPIFNGTIF